MEYRNTELKIDQLVSYCNENKINLAPAFQRGHVWTLPQRKGLLKNIITKKPIPAIFLYKEASGSKYSYNILDGKQRLESIILFINDSYNDFKIPRWRDYFFNSLAKKHANFPVDCMGQISAFTNLPEPVIRDFREYSIPTIEITMGENTNLSEIISLFVDINQQGEKVTRFNIVKAMCDNSKILESVFHLIAQRQRRGKDIFYKLLKNEITRCLGHLREIASERENNRKVDRIWERLLEILQYLKTGNYKRSSDILKSFITGKFQSDVPITRQERKSLTRACSFINKLAQKLGDDKVPLLQEYTHFYTLITMLAKNPSILEGTEESTFKKFVALSELLQKKRLRNASQKLNTCFKAYKEASVRQTADPLQREVRESQMKKMLELL